MRITGIIFKGLHKIADVSNNSLEVVLRSEHNCLYVIGIVTIKYVNDSLQKANYYGPVGPFIIATELELTFINI